MMFQDMTPKSKFDRKTFQSEFKCNPVVYKLKSKPVIKLVLRVSEIIYNLIKYNRMNLTSLNESEWILKQRKQTLIFTYLIVTEYSSL